MTMKLRRMVRTLQQVRHSLVASVYLCDSYGMRFCVFLLFFEIKFYLLNQNSNCIATEHVLPIDRMKCMRDMIFSPKSIDLLTL